uniref:Cytochrome P450 n=1 Tax=Megaselia scalaris TaxID=36166 RepID=T1GHM3_MEGSC
MFSKQTLRKHSVLSFLIRKSVDDYIVPQTKSLIKKGTFIIIPVDAIHHDQDIYPDPEVFDPERFTPEAINSRPSCSYLAFGEGPRNCIGLRFGKMEIRAGLVSLLRKFKFSISDKPQYQFKEGSLIPQKH